MPDGPLLGPQPLPRGSPERNWACDMCVRVCVSQCVDAINPQGYATKDTRLLEIKHRTATC